MIELRSYQQEAVNAVYKHLREREDNPCVVLPVGSGKTWVIAQIASDAVNLWGGRVLVLAHVKELLEQNASKIKLLSGELGKKLDVGVYSAGLKSRDTNASVIVAGIQSVHKRSSELGAFDLIIIDEAHTINPTDGEGMYRTFLRDAKNINPNVRVIGLTATPFRLKGGEICKPENILNAICYDAGIKEMIANGYLSKLKSKSGKVKADLASLDVRGGEFVTAQAIEAMDKYTITNSAVAEIVALTENRRSVLIFATSVEHCQHILAELRKALGRGKADSAGGGCEMLTGQTRADQRAQILSRFRGEQIATDLFGTTKPAIKYLVNVNVLTTGFDAPNVDCVVLLRPTASPGLLVQMIGRGTRLCEGKEDCLILDYGGNILRHGPVDAIRIADKTSESKGSGEAPAKECLQCQELLHAAFRNCPECGFEFPIATKATIDDKASDEFILSEQIEDTTYAVHAVHYSVHTKRGADEFAPKTMRVEYEIGFRSYVSEWVCPEHDGWARKRFVKWWQARSCCDVPYTAQRAVELCMDGALSKPEDITVRSFSGKSFDRVIGYSLPEPAPLVSSVPVCRHALADYNTEAQSICADDESWIDDLPF